MECEGGSSKKFCEKILGQVRRFKGAYHEIDIPNYVRIINGVDQLAQTRAALGI